MQSAMMAGRWKRFYENKRNRPYLQYIAVMDAATRHSHAELHGKIFHIDDPVWQSIWPPNGFNCRCRVRALTAAQAKQRGFNPKSKYQPTDNFPDKGFNHNAGIGQVANDIKAWKSWHKLDRLKNKRFVKEQQAQIMGSDGRLLLYNKAINRQLYREKVAKYPEIKELLAIGVLGGSEFAFLKEKHTSLDNGILVVADKNTIGYKAKKHERLGNRLNRKDLKNLVMYLTGKKTVLFDKQSGEIVYLIKSKNDPRTIKIVFNAGVYAKDGWAGAMVRTLFYIDEQTVKAMKNDSNKYEKQG